MDWVPHLSNIVIYVKLRYTFLPTSRDCANFCAATAGCQAFVYVDQTDTVVNGAAVQSACYLKKAAGTATAYGPVTSGAFIGNNTAGATYCEYRRPRPSTAASPCLVNAHLYAQ